MDGPNLLPRAAGESLWRILWRQVDSPLIMVLVASAVVAALLGERTDAAVVGAVVVINTLIGFFQEYRAGRAIEALSSLVPESVTVIRAGARRTVPARPSWSAATWWRSPRATGCRPTCACSR